MKQKPNGASAGPLMSRFVDRLMRHSSLTELEKRAILSLPGDTRSFVAGKNIVRPGCEGDVCHFVVEGIVARLDETESGRRQATGLFVPGDACDLDHLVVPSPKRFLSALTDCRVLQVPLRRLEQLAKWYPTLGGAFWRDAVIDASVSAKWIGNMTLRDGRARTAHLLCELGARMEACGAGGKAFILKVAQHRLAEVVGLTPVHTNRVLRQLQDQDLIFNSRGIGIRDWHGLCRLAEFDATYLHLSSA